MLVSVGDSVRFAFIYGLAMFLMEFMQHSICYPKIFIK